MTSVKTVITNPDNVFIKSKCTTIRYEFSEKDGESFYPIQTLENRNRLLLYKQNAEPNKNVIFFSRLAEYQYFNMDQVVANSLNILKKIQND